MEKVLLALLVLAACHVGLYLFLTGDARSGLDALAAKYEAAELASVKQPAAPPAPGTQAFSPWVRSFERYAAARDHEMHSRHEALMRWGMIGSFLIAVVILAAALQRLARTRAREARPTPVRVKALRGAEPAARRYLRSA